MSMTHKLPNGNEIKLTPTDGNHIYVEGDITVRGKTQNISSHWHRWSDGWFHLGVQGKPDHERRRSMYVNGGGTTAFIDKATELLTPAINKWTIENESAIMDAKLKQHQDAIAHRDAQITEHLNAITALRAELAELAAGKTLGTYSSVKDYHFGHKPA